MQIVILAGGKATRLGDLAKNIPKAMVKINNKPFLEYQIELLKNKGLKDIVLCIGHLGAVIKNYFEDGKKFGVRIQYSEERDKLLDTAGALKKAAPLLNDEFFVMYGDAYLPIDYTKVEKYFKRSAFPALMVVYKNFNKYGKSNVIVKDNLVVDYNKDAQKNGMVYIDYGVLSSKKEVLNYIPKNKVFPMGILFKKLIDKKALGALETKVPFYEIGSVEGLRRFERMIKRK